MHLRQVCRRWVVVADNFGRISMVSAPTPSMPSEGFIDLRQVLQVIPVSRSTWYTMVSGGLAPKPIRLGARRVGYAVEDVRALIEKLKATSSSLEIPSHEGNVIRLTLTLPGMIRPFKEVHFSPEASIRIMAMLKKAGTDLELSPLFEALHDSSSPEHG